MISDDERNSLSARWLVERVKILSHQIIGAECPDFTFTNVNDQKVNLKDFRGKIVVLDFCASWCGPCRKEMRSMLKIYNELKAAINLETHQAYALDDSQAKWRKDARRNSFPG